MRKALWLAFWEWSPGVVGGGLPLLVFWLAELINSNQAVGHYELRLDAHLLLMAMVTASVSVITSFGRILTGKIPNILRDGRAPILLIMLSLAMLVYSTAIYGFVEIGAVPQPGDGLKMMALAGLAAVLISSLYMEFAIARLHVLASKRRQGRRAGKGGNGGSGSAPSVSLPGG